MRSFEEVLRACRGSLIKARREYIRERGWRGDEWYVAWREGLGDEVERAARNGKP